MTGRDRGIDVDVVLTGRDRGIAVDVVLTGRDRGIAVDVVLTGRDRGIAVDVVSRLVYYTDSDSIFAMKLDGGYPFSLIKSGRPRRALVLDPPRG